MLPISLDIAIKGHAYAKWKINPDYIKKKKKLFSQSIFNCEMGQ